MSKGRTQICSRVMENRVEELETEVYELKMNIDQLHSKIDNLEKELEYSIRTDIMYIDLQKYKQQKQKNNLSQKHMVGYTVVKIPTEYTTNQIEEFLTEYFDQGWIIHPVYV